jgi:hypothetical protein
MPFHTVNTTACGVEQQNVSVSALFVVGVGPEQWDSLPKMKLLHFLQGLSPDSSECRPEREAAQGERQAWVNFQL